MCSAATLSKSIEYPLVQPDSASHEILLRVTGYYSDGERNTSIPCFCAVRGENFRNSSVQGGAHAQLENELEQLAGVYRASRNRTIDLWRNDIARIFVRFSKKHFTIVDKNYLRQTIGRSFIPAACNRQTTKTRPIGRSKESDTADIS